jgi:hypothetical protein
VQDLSFDVIPNLVLAIEAVANVERTVGSPATLGGFELRPAGQIRVVSDGEADFRTALPGIQTIEKARGLRLKRLAKGAKQLARVGRLCPLGLQMVDQGPAAELPPQRLLKACDRLRDRWSSFSKDPAGLAAVAQVVDKCGGEIVKLVA